MASRRRQKDKANAQKSYKILDYENILNWSDEESDYVVKPPVAKVESRPRTGDKTPMLTSRSTTARPPPDPTVQPAILSETHLKDHKRSQFQGDATLRPTRKLESEEELQAMYHFDIPLPYIPAHIRDFFGLRVIYQLWSEFLEYGADESEMVQFRYLAEIEKRILESTGEVVELTKIKYCGVDKDDYVEFRDLLNQLCTKFVPKPIPSPPKIDVFACCANTACASHVHHRKVLPRRPHLHHDTSSLQYHALHMQYVRECLRRHGKVRIRDVQSMLDAVGIPYDSKVFPLKFWEEKGVFVLPSLNAFLDFATTLRTDIDKGHIYSVPSWLQHQFSAGEVNYYVHHFEKSDAHCTGHVNREQFVAVFKSLNATIEPSQVEILFEQFGKKDEEEDIETVEFGQFLAILYRLRQHTLTIRCPSMLSVLEDTKKHTKTFEQIMNVQLDPVRYVSLLRFSFRPGFPVVAEFVINGPLHTLYYYGSFHLKITFLKGFPYKCPEVAFTNRIFSVSGLVNANGMTTLPHLEYIWDGGWTIRRLLVHLVEDVFCSQPNLKFANPSLVKIAKLWSFEIKEDAALTIAKAAIDAEEDARLKAIDVEAEEEEAKRKSETSVDASSATAKEDCSVAVSGSVLDESSNPTHSDVGKQVDDGLNSDSSKGDSNARNTGNMNGPETTDKSMAVQSTSAVGSTGSSAANEHNMKNSGQASSIAESSQPQSTTKEESTANSGSPEDKPSKSGEEMEWFDREDLLGRFSRIEQMHVNVIALFLHDRARYDKTVVYYVDEFAGGRKQKAVEEKLRAVEIECMQREEEVEQYERDMRRQRLEWARQRQMQREYELTHGDDLEIFQDENGVEYYLGDDGEYYYYDRGEYNETYGEEEQGTVNEKSRNQTSNDDSVLYDGEYDGAEENQDAYEGNVTIVERISD